MSLSTLLPFFTSSGIKVWISKPRANVQPAIFKLYRFTACAMGIASSLSMAKQLFGDPITCLSDSGPDKVDKFINDYCWFHGTETFNTGNKSDELIAHPGIFYTGESGGMGMKNTPPERIHEYYQWIGFALFLQALLFVLPPYWWKVNEGGRIGRWINCKGAAAKKPKATAVAGGGGGETSSKTPSEQNRDGAAEVETDLALLGADVGDRIGSFGCYATKYFVLELVGVCALFGHFLFIDWMLDGHFLRLGLDVIYFDGKWRDKHHPLDMALPKLGSCTVTRSTGNGNYQNYETLCIIPLNVINEKIYLCLWFWLCFVSLTAGLHLVITVLLVFLSYPRVLFLRWRSPYSSKRVITVLTYYASFSDWFVINLILKNIVDEKQRSRFLYHLTSKVNRKRRKLERILSGTRNDILGHKRTKTQSLEIA